MRQHNLVKYSFGFLLLLFVQFTQAQTQEVKQLDVQSFVDSLEKQPQVLLDVRTSKEYQEGTIAYAQNLDWTARESFQEQAKQLDKSQPVYLFCRSGGRSKQAADYLSKQGFQVFELKGGILQYQAEGLEAQEQKAEQPKPQPATSSSPQTAPTESR